MNYMVVSIVGGNSYLTTVSAASLVSAEHIILDKGICGKHTYGVDGCIAFDLEGMKTETFIARAMSSKTVSLYELEAIIEERNREIFLRDKAEEIVASALKEANGSQQKTQVLLGEAMNALNNMRGVRADG